jgi:choline dehydrogenase-like flavoprotein
VNSSTADLPLTTRQWGALLALGDVLIPADEFPSASAAGLRTFFERNARDFGESVMRRIVAGLDALVAIDFDRLPAEQCRAIVARIDADDATLAWPEPASRWLRLVLGIVAQSYYSNPANGGNAAGASWRMVGFDPAPKRALPLHEDAAPKITPVAQVRAEYDAVVVGSGAGGGIVAQVLAEAGLDVLLIERGRSLQHADVGRDHLRNHRFPAYGHNTGPDADGHPRVFERGGRAVTSRPHEQIYSNNAMTVGGGTRVYGAQAWRYAPEDFRMASVYGVPEGSGLADWPIDYDELAPWYARAEREIGVAGEIGHAHHGARGPYPMAPFPLNADGRVLRGAAGQLGWRAAAIPLAINTRGYDGRPACVRCGTCVGFSCPSNAKNGSHNTAIPRALATGRCQLLTGALVGSLVCDTDGQARGVHMFVEDDETIVERTVYARTIVVSAGAIETARLLLNSRSKAHPGGLGNRHDQVGRYLQGHLYSGAVGLYHDVVQDCEGPGVSIATCEFNHGNPGVIGGGMLGNEFVPLPIHFWSAFAPPGARWGLAGKRFFADAYRKTLVVMGPIQEIPNPNARVTVDADVRDRFGLPVARLSGEVHAESVRAAAMLRTKAETWLRCAGVTALRSWGGDHRGVLSAGQHQAGTCRMGDVPASSVTDRNGRVHGQRALFIADGSLHVTNGGFNPVLTIIANAYRIADGIVSRAGA